MAGVYSTKLWTAPSFTGGPTLVYTSPPGYITVLRTISVVWGDVTVSGLDFWAQMADLTKLVRITLATGLTPMTIGGAQVWEARWVLDEGDTIALQTATGTCDVAGMGYLLTLP